jgi:hypothetical protein
MQTIIAILILLVSVLTAQQKSELVGNWLLDSKTEFLRITSDSIFFNAGVFNKVIDDEINHKLNLSEKIVSYDIYNNKMLLTNDINTEVDTLINIDSDSLYGIWYSLNNALFTTVLIKNKDSTIFGFIMKSDSFAYNVNSSNITPIGKLNLPKFEYIIEGNILKLIHSNSNEIFIYSKL